MPVLMRTAALILLLFLPSVVHAQNPAQDDEADTPKDSVKGFDFKFKDRPSFRYGDLRMDIKAKWHLDFQRFYPPITNLPTTGTFNLTRARFGLKGEVTKFFEYEVERDFRGAFVEDPPRHPWK